MIIILSWIVAIIFLGCGIYLLLKKHPVLAIYPLGFAAAFFLVGQPWFQGFLKTGIIYKLTDYGNRLDTFQETMAQLQGDVSTQQTKIKIAQTNISTQQTAITNQYDKIARVQAELYLAHTNLNIQQKRIRDVEDLVQNLYGRMTFDTINMSDTNRLYTLPYGDIRCYVFRLREPAILNSVQGVVVFPGLGQQPIMTTPNYRNVAFIIMANPLPDNGWFTFQYVRDIKETNKVGPITIINTNLYIDNVLITIPRG